MTGGAQIGLLNDGRRLHLHHGPIDLIVEAFGEPDEIRRAYAQAADSFGDLLQDLVDELALLRTPVGDHGVDPLGAVAKHMVAAARRHPGVFVTPMAAVAGAVADYVLAALTSGPDLKKAYVNNGGDIALHLTSGEVFTTGMVFDADSPTIDGLACITHDMPVRGIATSGWRGRSLSRGIADSVTVLARTAAEADVAATLIANAVDVEDDAIRRLPAREVRDESDLGNRLVTVDVGVLDRRAIEIALGRGYDLAGAMLGEDLIAGAALALQGSMVTTGLEPVGSPYEVPSAVPATLIA